MPVKELAELLQPEDPQVTRIAAPLPYRDFMTAGLLVRRMRGGRRDALPTACRRTTGSTSRSRT